MIRIIKTIYLRKQDRFAKGKKVTATDERYLRQAEENLYSELSILLGVPKNDMEEYITVRLDRKQKAWILCNNSAIVFIWLNRWNIIL